MKKENVVKKILETSLIGFPIGVTLLIISYICVYFISDENTFQNEFSNLQNIETLISQVIILGSSYYIIFIDYNMFKYYNNNEIYNIYISKPLYKTILVLLSIALNIVIILLFNNIGIFSRNIATINIIILILLYILFVIYFSIKCIIDSNLIKKINKEIKRWCII